MWLLVLFIAIPLIEIALFIQVGGWLTLWPTLAIVVATAVIGTWLVRQQGRQTMIALRRSLSDLRDPTAPLAHGAMILFSGALLLTPGFLTDAIGFALLMPPVRDAILRQVRARMRVETMATGRPQPRDAWAQDVVEGDYVDTTPQDPETPKRPTHRPSGWTRH